MYRHMYDDTCTYMYMYMYIQCTCTCMATWWVGTEATDVCIWKCLICDPNTVTMLPAQALFTLCVCACVCVHVCVCVCVCMCVWAGMGVWVGVQYIILYTMLDSRLLQIMTYHKPCKYT